MENPCCQTILDLPCQAWRTKKPITISMCRYQLRIKIQTVIVQPFWIHFLTKLHGGMFLSEIFCNVLYVTLLLRPFASKNLISHSIYWTYPWSWLFQFFCNCRSVSNLQHYCRVCNTQLNSCKQSRIHAEGKKHEKRLAYLKFCFENGKKLLSN